MAKYRKKPVVVEAIQMTRDRMRQLSDTDPWPDWLKEAWDQPESEGGIWSTMGGFLMIGTLEGNHQVQEGDWIIKGIKGELYPCKPDIFEATYEPMEE